MRFLLLIAGTLIATSCSAPPLASNITVDRFEARMVVDPRGSAEVEETWVLRATGGGDAWLRRVVPGGRHDGLSQIRATLGDRPIDPDPDGAVTWRLARDGAPQTGRLRYTAAGVVEVSGGRGRITWRVLETAAAPMAEARLALGLPDVMVTLDRPGVVEPGWRISQGDREVIVDRTSVQTEDSATLVAELSIDAGTLARPVWQEYKERATFLVPAFISAGLFIVVVGLGVVVMVAAQRTSWTPADRAGVVRNLFVAALVTVILAVLVAMAIPPLLGRFGTSPMAIPIGIAMVGGVLAVTGQALKMKAQ